MPTIFLLLCSLLLLQCTLGQYAESRLDGYGSFPIIPPEFLALKNYGAVDFLSSPIIESNKPNILSTFPATLAPEVASGNLFIKSNPCMSISAPVSFEVPRVINQVIPQSHLILETPLTLFDPIETAYELDSYAASIPNGIPPVISNLYVEEDPILIANLPSFEVPVLFNFAELNPFISPNTLSVIPTSLSPILEVSSNKFYVPTIEVPTIPQVVPFSATNLGPVVDVLSPMIYEVPVAIEPPMNLNSYTGPTPLAVELPAIEIPTYSKPQIPVPTLSSESIASTIANIKSIFPSLPTLPPSSRVRSLSGISSSNLSASRGSGLFVTSSSPKRSTGISIRSENTYQGSVLVSGILPFLGTVGFSGSLPSSGYGTVNYGCGSGNIGIMSEAPNILNSFYPRP